eukprot:jgi/Chrzof1/12572/UNPLg00525.t1
MGSQLSYRIQASVDAVYNGKEVLASDEPSACPLPFLPGFCWNVQHDVAAFPVDTPEAYITLCDYPHLSFEQPGPIQCMMLINSVLVTLTRHSFVLIIRDNATLDAQYQAMVDRMKVKIVRFKPFDLPREGIHFHVQDGHENWLHSYQRFNMWKLTQYKRLMYIDADIVALENLDHLFALKHDSMSCDCTPHSPEDAVPDPETGLLPYGFRVAFVGNGGMVLFTPSQKMFDNIMARLQNGVLPGGKRWKYWGGDQQLIIELFGHHHGHASLLPANVQIFPDVCYTLKDPSYQFPIHRFYVLHNTWTDHAKYGHWDDLVKHKNACWEQLMQVNRYFRDRVLAAADKLKARG